MSSTTDRIKGAANETAGKAKQAIGGAVGSDRLQAEGAVQEAKGSLQTAAGKAKDAAKNVVDKM